MRYRIIREYDDNGTRGFYCDVWHRSMFGSGWKPIKKYHIRMSYPRRFESVEEVEKYLRSLNVNREIVKESDFGI